MVVKGIIVLTQLNAGTATSSLTTDEWAMALLLKHPEAVQKVEIRASRQRWEIPDGGLCHRWVSRPARHNDPFVNAWMFE
ncbi:unnamed protein product [Urochloa humidicola]